MLLQLIAKIIQDTHPGSTIQPWDKNVGHGLTITWKRTASSHHHIGLTIENGELIYAIDSSYRDTPGYSGGIIRLNQPENNLTTIVDKIEQACKRSTRKAKASHTRQKQ